MRGFSSFPWMTTLCLAKQVPQRATRASVRQALLLPTLAEPPMQRTNHSAEEDARATGRRPSQRQTSRSAQARCWLAAQAWRARTKTARPCLQPRVGYCHCSGAPVRRESSVV